MARAAALACTVARVSQVSAQARTDRYDIVIKGGRVIDPGRDLHGLADIGIRDGRIAAVEPDIALARAERSIDATGKLVTAGLVDLHAHVFSHGTPIGATADELVARTGATTFVSAGDAGAANFAQFKRYVATQRRCRIYAFLHIAETGLAAYPAPELLDLAKADVDAAARTIAENHDIVLGAAVRQSASAVGANGLEPLKRAIAAVERAGTRGRVMCQIGGGAPGNLADLLALLRPRDVLSHVYGASDNDVVQGGKLLDAAVAARRRGVVIDVGHGGSHFDFAIAEAAIHQGLIPDVISSGVQAHGGVAPATPLLPAVMSTFLNLGFGLEQVIAMTTSNPARVIGRDPWLGTLALGAPADVAILELVEGPVRFADARKNVREGKRWLRPVQTLRSGVVVGKADPARPDGSAERAKRTPGK